MDKQITIAVHSGNFHADDIFAVATLFLVFGEGAKVLVMRTRDMEVIEKADYVADVGGVYDESKSRFDHHQLGGAGVRPNSIPYASFGLVWKKYGEGLCGDREIADRIDQVLVQPIDAIDNGLQFTETKIKEIFPYSIVEFFDAFVPTWKENKNDMDDIFMKLVSYAQLLLKREIIKSKHKLEAGLIVEKIYKESKDRRLIIFDRHYPSEEFLSKFPEPIFVVSPREDGAWVIESIRDNVNTFVSRKNLPKDWAGKTGEELEKVTGIPGALFCHTGCFIAVAKTKEAILKMAELALNS